MPVSESIEVAKLKLDPGNPRLPLDLQPRDQLGLLRFFAREYSLEEIGESMAKYGFFEEEPLLVIEDADDVSRFLVIEGNRRLAALQLLTDPETRAAVARPKWDAWANEAAGHDLTAVPCFRYGQRDELANYLGFRHVSGIIKWTAEAKARFITSLIDHKQYSFYEAGRAIGSRADAIRRQYFAYRALRVAHDAGVDVGRAEQSFGVWYRALQNPGIRQYAGIRGWIEDLPPGASPLEKGTQPIVEVLEWVFGGGDEGNDPRPVIRDSRELDRLGSVLADNKAVAILKSEESLPAAETMLVADRANILGALNSAVRYVILAIGEADRFIGDVETIEMAQRLNGRVQRLLQLLQAGGQTLAVSQSGSAPQPAPAPTDSDSEQTSDR